VLDGGDRFPNRQGIETNPYWSTSFSSNRCVSGDGFESHTVPSAGVKDAWFPSMSSGIVGDLASDQELQELPIDEETVPANL